MIQVVAPDLIQRDDVADLGLQYLDWSQQMQDEIADGDRNGVGEFIPPETFHIPQQLDFP